MTAIYNDTLHYTTS